MAQVKKGTLSFMVLAILRNQEYYGYELIERIRAYSDMEIAEGTLYPLLNRLKKDGLVTSKWVEQPSGIPRKYYTLSKEGITTLEAMSAYWFTLDTSIKRIMK